MIPEIEMFPFLSSNSECSLILFLIIDVCLYPTDCLLGQFCINGARLESPYFVKMSNQQDQKYNYEEEN